MNSVGAPPLKAKVAPPCRKLREEKLLGGKPKELTQDFKKRLKCAARMGLKIPLIDDK